MLHHAGAFILLCTVVKLAAAVKSIVDLNYTSYNGTQIRPADHTEWLGMRYAAAPIGSLRFAAPHDPISNATVQNATDFGPLCLATPGVIGSNTTLPESEDCLFLNVFAPSNLTTSSKLPVYFFISGGGFNALANPNLNGSDLITAAGNNIIVVTFNYRLGPYGFMAASEIASPNNGLKDMMKALEWVQKYIALFGGDPDHVVLGGDSAGAAAIALLMTAFGGDNHGLFHGAIGEEPGITPLFTTQEAQYQYDNFAVQTECVGYGGNWSSLECLRNLTSDELQSANVNIAYPGAPGPPLYMWGPTLDGDMIPDYLHSSFAAGKFAKIPCIFGDDENGGTIFAPRTTSNVSESNSFLVEQFPNITLTQLASLNAMFPNPNKTCESGTSGCWWQQAANVFDEIQFKCPALYMNSALTRYNISDSWAYLYNVKDPALVAAGYGVPHTIEVNAVFGPTDIAPLTPGGVPRSYFPGGVNAQTVPIIQAYWSSFIRDLNPNTYRLSGTPEWIPWTTESKSNALNRLIFETNSTRNEGIDGGLKTRCEFIDSIALSLQQ
jgi:cholinesterase